MSWPAAGDATLSHNAPPWVSRLAGSGGIALACAWGFAEGTLFFVVPDVLISLAALCAWRRALRHVGAAVAGSVVAGALMYGWAAVSPARAREVIRRVPFVRERMLAQVDAGLERDSVAALFRGAFTGVPYKIFAVQAPGRMPVAVFLPATVPARAARFLLVWLVFGAAGSWIRKRRPAVWNVLAWIHAGFWVPFYVWYWSVI